MKFKFDARQDFQLKAISSIVDLFEGQSKINKSRYPTQSLLGIYANQLTIEKEEILLKTKQIHDQNNVMNGEKNDELDFSIEMETGTGKTYVYLRTIFELNNKYGWKKFIILVPSVAIREGVLKTLKITEDHFKELYNNIPYRYYEYQSKNISQVKHFAESNNIEIMIMTIGAFNKDANVLHNARDQMQGEKPINYIKQTNPILILDEPQNMEGEATREKLKEFNSLFKVRYSATHKSPYNLVYQLTPYDAYQSGLVKKIEVYSVTDDETGLSNIYIHLIDVKSSKSDVKATIEVLVKDKTGVSKRKKIIVKQHDNLAIKTNNKIYTDYIVEGMTVENPEFNSIGSITFKNGIKMKLGQEVGGVKDDLIREQIKQTIKLHFEKKNKLKGLGIKVLSLFFIDRVDNYIKQEGVIRKLFIEEFEDLKKAYGYESIDVAKVHKGYFALKNDEYLEKEKAIAENKEAYELIMKDKERLLSFDEPTEFIFSHSALREGWDNPNVFNICTLNMTTSTMKKRQEIGRGMRLCVNQTGDRIFLKNINLLSVIANESYSSYVSQLQSEFIEDGIYKAPPTPENAKKRIIVKLKQNFDKNDNFQALWDRISKKTKFIVSINTQKLITDCCKMINQDVNIPKPQLKVERIGVDINKKGVESVYIGNVSQDIQTRARIVDLINIIKDETKLTKATIIEILSKLTNIKYFFNNPEKFTFEIIKIIKNELIAQYIEQIEYEIVASQYEIKQFEQLESYKDSILPVDNSIYEAIIFESEPEKEFALELNQDERIKLFIKLPDWFKVKTPIGSYNPDWAIVTVKRDLQGIEGKEKIYFVIETKSNLNNLRSVEQAKIKSAKKHFQVLGINYKEIESYPQFSTLLQ